MPISQHLWERQLQLLAHFRQNWMGLGFLGEGLDEFWCLIR